MRRAQDSGGSARVVVLIDLLSGGGAERVAVDLAGGLDPARFRAELLVTRKTGPLEELARSHGLALTILNRRWGFGPGKFWRAVRVVRSGDLLHAHKFAGGCWGVLIAGVARRPVIVHEHSAYGGRPSRVRPLLYRHWIARRALSIICVSDDVAASLAAEGIDRALLDVVPNGVPPPGPTTAAEARRELGLAEDALVLGIVGRLRSEKRHDLLLRAAAALRDDGSKFVVCIVGDGPERGKLQELAAALALDDVIVWAGERDQAGRLAPAFDVAVLCSDFEGMPLAALEALGAGVPLVATEVGALPQLLSGGAGILVPPDDPTALAAGLRQLLHDADLRTRMGAQGRELVRDRFSLERSVAHIERIYERALSDDS